MNPAAFRAKWSKVALRELQAYQEHFHNLCQLVGHPTPAEADPTGTTFCYQKGASKQSGGEGWADVWKRHHFAIEYKGKGKDLDAAYRQLLQYRADLENPPLLIVTDFDRILIRTNFDRSRVATYEITLATVEELRSLEILRAAFFDPDALRPEKVVLSVTQEAARRLGELAQSLAKTRSDLAPLQIARFLDRLVFCFFAEDVGILPGKVVSQLLNRARSKPELFPKLSSDLFCEMAGGGSFGVEVIPHINGSLFDNAETIELSGAQLQVLHEIAQLDWKKIDPSIFGTLFERGLDPAKRSQLGAHYTSRDDIETLVEPVLMAPLRKEWENTRARALGALSALSPASGEKPSPAQVKKIHATANEILLGFLDRLRSVKVLDPACGSGNFLYVALQLLKNLELEVQTFYLDQGLQPPLREGVSPKQLFGIEINEYAHGLAQLTVWIGYLQWLHEHSSTAWKEPILEAMSNIERKDAILDLSDPENPKEPEWPRADVIVGNPPFLGDKLMRGELGDPYVDALRSLFEGRLPGQSDLCCYWFERALAEISARRAKRAGLLATQAIRGGANRHVLDRIKSSGDIFWAESDRPWILDGAAVHVSMVAFDLAIEQHRVLDGREVPAISARLTFGADLTQVRRLLQNGGTGFIAPTKGGDFDLIDSEGLELLKLGGNPGGRPNSDVLVPLTNARAFLQRGAPRWLIDFSLLTEHEAALYEAPFALVTRRVYPSRSKNRDTWLRTNWWKIQRNRPELRLALADIPRYLATPRHAKHRIFDWFRWPHIADDSTTVFARADDTFFGLLHSRLHEVWALAQGTQLREKESGFRYTPTTCFETFPFPQMTDPQREAIGAAAQELNELRQRWLNPPEWTKEEVLEFPGAIDGPWKRFVVDPDARGIGTARWPRIVPKDAASAKELTDRTLTKLYNKRPAWLQNAHRKLDEAVFAAYGWPVDLTDEQILERLLALNLERAGQET